MNARRDREATPRQLEVLAWIRLFIEKNRLPPTMRELCKGFGWASTQGATCHLKALEAKGYLTRIPSGGRSIVLTENPVENDGAWDVAAEPPVVMITMTGHRFGMAKIAAIEFANAIIEEANKL